MGWMEVAWNSSCRFKSDKFIQFMWHDSGSLHENLSRHAGLDVVLEIRISSHQHSAKQDL